MKIKMIIGIIIGAIVLFLAFGFYKATTLKLIEITKKVSINAPKEEVYKLISLQNNYSKWSPFLAKDSSLQYNIKGIDGTVGTQLHWTGNKGKEVGFQEVTKLIPHEFIGMKCDIQKPFKAQPTFDYTLNQTGNSTEVIQKFTLKSELVDAFFMWLFGVKKEMETTNQLGLDLLKKAAEN